MTTFNFSNTSYSSKGDFSFSAYTYGGNIDNFGRQWQYSFDRSGYNNGTPISFTINVQSVSGNVNYEITQVSQAGSWEWATSSATLAEGDNTVSVNINVNSNYLLTIKVEGSSNWNNSVEINSVNLTVNNGASQELSLDGSSSSPPAAAPTESDFDTKSLFSDRYGVGFAINGGDSMNQYDTANLRIQDGISKLNSSGFNMIRNWSIDSLTGDFTTSESNLSTIINNNNNYTITLLEAIRDFNTNNGTDIKIQLGVWIQHNTTTTEWKKRIDDSFIYSQHYSDIVIGISLGNEQLSYPSDGIAINESDLEEHIDYYIARRDEITSNDKKKPVTYTYGYAAYTGRKNNSDFQNAYKKLDYFNWNLYSFHDNRGSVSEYFPYQQFVWVNQQGNSIHDYTYSTLNIEDKRAFILSETGWQGTDANSYAGINWGSDERMKEYYFLITQSIYFQTSTNFDAMFYFNFSDEAWKGMDNNWGLYRQAETSTGNNLVGESRFSPNIIASDFITNNSYNTSNSIVSVSNGFNTDNFSLYPTTSTNVTFNNDSVTLVSSGSDATIYKSGGTGVTNNNTTFQNATTEFYRLRVSYKMISNSPSSNVFNIFVRHYENTSNNPTTGFIENEEYINSISMTNMDSYQNADIYFYGRFSDVSQVMVGFELSGSSVNSEESVIINNYSISLVSESLICFRGDTQVKTSEGYKNIESLKRGDLIMTNAGLQPLSKLHKSKPIPMIKIPTGLLGENLPNRDVFVCKWHPLSVKILTDDNDDEPEFLHMLAGELEIFDEVKKVSRGDAAYNLIFDKHHEIDVGGLKFLSHHPNHNGGRHPRLVEGEEMDASKRAKKVYVSKDGKFVNYKGTSIKKMLAEILRFK